jgi:putative alpha-1,2-mannosidase
MISSVQACANAEEEISEWNWDTVEQASKTQWEDILGAITTDAGNEDTTVVTLLYSSVGGTNEMIE